MDQSSKKNIVALTGAGISAESGLKTFRDSGGLWENYDVYDVASIDAWHRDKDLVLRFYNDRRKQAAQAEPNDGHKALAYLEQYFNVFVVTQNVDSLHEKAGSTQVVHLHGELSKVRSTADPSLIYDYEDRPIHLGDTCEKGAQLRPHIVWFGEEVPMMETAARLTIKADIFMVIGTSLVVYPAASLIHYVSQQAPIYIIDPNLPPVQAADNIKMVEAKATVGVPQVAEELIEKYT